MKVTWPQVTLILGITLIYFTAIVVLTKLDVDAQSVMTTCVVLLLGLLGALGFRNQSEVTQKLDQVKDLSNGRIREVMEDNRRLQRRVEELAMRLPPDKQ